MDTDLDLRSYVCWVQLESSSRQTSRMTSTIRAGYRNFNFSFSARSKCQFREFGEPKTGRFSPTTKKLVQLTVTVDGAICVQSGYRLLTWLPGKAVGKPARGSVIKQCVRMVDECLQLDSLTLENSVYHRCIVHCPIFSHC